MKYPKISKQQQAALGAAAAAVLIGILLYCLINAMRSRKKDSSTRIPTIHTNKDRPSLRSRLTGREPRHAPWHFGDGRDGINARGRGPQGFRGPTAPPSRRPQAPRRPLPPGEDGGDGPSGLNGYLPATRTPIPGANGYKGPRPGRKGFERPYNKGYSYDFYEDDFF
tara:strand:- start:3665 stop:4165 length:501 start_codon:yes stop_codon:yes gene_type:complete